VLDISGFERHQERLKRPGNVVLAHNDELMFTSTRSAWCVSRAPAARAAADVLSKNYTTRRLLQTEGTTELPLGVQEPLRHR
jgi:hypothetical protein